jgi:hypothetical protein
MRAGVLAQVAMVALTATSSGCAMIPSRALRTDEAIVKGRAVEGYVVMAVNGARWRPESDLFGGSFCQDGDLNRCVAFGPQSTADGYRAYALPPGTWCVTQAWVQNGDFVLDVSVERARFQCFPVVDNAVSYPGHVEVQMEDSQFPGSARTGFAFAGVEGAREQALAKYPALAPLAWTTPVVGPIDAPADAPAED